MTIAEAMAPYPVRYIVTLVGAMLLSASLLLPPDFQSARMLGWLVSAYTLMLPLLLPRRIAWFGVLTVLCIIGIVSAINNLKIQLTSFPLTILDIRVSFANPQGLMSALGLPYWVGIVAIVVLLGLWATAGVLLGRRRGRDSHSAVRCFRASAFVGITVLAVALGYLDFTARFNDRVSLLANAEGVVWESDGVSALARELGGAAFLIYSLRLERSDVNYMHTSRDAQIQEDALRRAISARVTLPRTGARLPNIILVSAESTFDPNRIFRLAVPVRNALFEHNRYTRLLTPLRVNPIGGGTWISEFESLVGVDTRLFGYAGYYTHITLAPYVRRSLATHLAARGYRTTTIYSSEGEFYGARNAFKLYGFDEFLDDQDLGLPSGWSATDERLADAAIDKLKSSQQSPFFSFVSFTENHAPHDCKHYSDSPEFISTFAIPASFELNCALNEYLRRTRSTENAIARLIGFLEERNRKTGEPFVLVVYGDHQPHTFTGTDGMTSDFSRFRADHDKRITFLHVMSSMAGVMTEWPGPPPHLTIIPTLISSFAASTVEDLYLPQNFLQHEVCGSDLLRSTEVVGFYGWGGKPPDEKDRCPILDALVTGYRKSGIFRLQ